MRSKAYWLLALSLCAGLIAAGCGDDDNGDNGAGDGTALGDGGEALAKEEYIAQGDEICAAGDEELAEELQAIEGGATEENAEKGAEVFVENLDSQLEQLRDLNPPEGDEETLTEIYDQAEEGGEQLSDDPQLILTEEGPPALAEASEKAQEYGFEECGS